MRGRFISLDNVSDHRAGTIDLQAEKNTRKSGFACIALLSCKSGQSVFVRYGLKCACNRQRTPFPSVTLFSNSDRESSQFDSSNVVRAMSFEQRPLGIEFIGLNGLHIHRVFSEDVDRAMQYLRSRYVGRPYRQFEVAARLAKACMTVELFSETLEGVNSSW